jgi:hypothetical protein
MGTLCAVYRPNIINAAYFKPLLLVKYADDTTLIIAEHSAVGIADEMENIQRW